MVPMAMPMVSRPAAAAVTFQFPRMLQSPLFTRASSSLGLHFDDLLLRREYPSAASAPAECQRAAWVSPGGPSDRLLGVCPASVYRCPCKRARPMRLAGPRRLSALAPRGLDVLVLARRLNVLVLARRLNVLILAGGLDVLVLA